MHVFTILNTWYMNTLTEANNKILLVGVILQDNLNSDDNLKHLLYMLEKFNMRSYISEKSFLKCMQSFLVSEFAVQKVSIPNTSRWILCTI